MPELKMYTLYSGSSGNSAYIKYGDTEVLIDAGRSARALCQALTALGTSAANISAVFVTHEHSDHTSALEILCRQYHIPVHLTEGSAQRLFSRGGEYTPSCAVLHRAVYREEIGGLVFESFPTPHDSADSVGFTVSADGRRALGYATDIGYVSDAVENGLCGCENVVIESNHDIEMLKEGIYPSYLKRRILSMRGHLSNLSCAEELGMIADSGARSIVLAHLSRENNTPELAYNESYSAIGERLRENGGSVALSVASSDTPTLIVREDAG